MNNSKIELLKKSAFVSSAPACVNCRYWSPLTITESIQAKDQGECRLNPPTAHMIMADTVSGARPAIMPGTMRTTADWWCGQHPVVRQHEAKAVLLSVVHLFRNAREQWELGILRDHDGKFTRTPTLAEARAFSGARGEPEKTAPPVAPVAGAVPVESAPGPVFFK